MIIKYIRTNNSIIKKISIDFIYSIVASALPIVVMQFILYPILAKQMNSSIYGEILTLIGIINTIYISLGTPLDNIRLIQNEKYNKNNVTGDFNILLFITNMIGSIIIVIISIFIFKLSFPMVVSLVVLIIFAITKSYYVVSYRLNLDFKKNICCSIVECIGYLIGIVFLKNYNILWIAPFILAQLFSLIYLMSTCNLYKEPLIITKYFKQTSIKYIWLIFSNIVGNMLTYLDRIIIFPILGGSAVSIFSTATFFGKSFSMVLLPIAGVLLSYLSQKHFNMTLKKYLGMNGIIFILVVIFIIFSNWVSPWITGLLYPTLISNSRQYIFIGNCAAIIGASAALCSPFIVKYAPAYWNFIISVLYGIFYLGLGLLLLKSSGLYGFCIAVLIVNILKLTFTFIIGAVYIIKIKKNGGN